MNEAGPGHGPDDVSVGACRCPGSPHDPDGDWVTLAHELTVPMGVAAAAEVGRAADGDTPAIAAGLARVYLSPAPVGPIIGWTMVDDHGDPEEITADTISRLIPWGDGGMELAEEGDRRYGAAIFAPFLRRQAGLLGYWADGHIDISEAALWRLAPDALLTILAQQAGGWSAVRGPGPISWREAQLMLRLLAEERVGRPMRAAEYGRRNQLDAEWEAARKAATAATGRTE